MGTNYYAIPSLTRVKKFQYAEDGKVIAEFNSVVELQRWLEDNRTIKVHIGKSSGGWKFLFHEQQGKFTNYPEFLDWLTKNVDTDYYVLVDEYGEVIPKDYLLDLIQRQQLNSNPGNFKFCENRDGYRFNRGDFS
ncbi:MAG: hypothetical protein J6J36_07010 [Clostridia bacterium]|nr:hypothetical protein [Clostridia bacterium]